MTTIAWDGEILAGDSQMTSGGTICGYVVKVIKQEGILIGFSGTPVNFNSFVKWLCYDTTKEPDWEAEWTALVITKDKEIREYEHNGKGEYISIPGTMYCIGSGEALARTAILCGKNAVDAVRMAAMSDIYTGGNVYWVSLLEDSNLTILTKPTKD